MNVAMNSVPWHEIQKFRGDYNVMKSILSHIALLVPSVDKSAVYLLDNGIKCGEPEVFESEGTKEIYVGDYQDQTGLLLLLEAIIACEIKRGFRFR